MRLRSLAVSCCAFALAACGGSPHKPPPFQWDGGTNDGGDGGDPIDAGTDSSVGVDAGPITCTPTTMTLLADSTGSNLSVALAGGAMGFLTVWTQNRSGVANAYSRFVPSTGTEDGEQTLNYASGGTIQSPAVTSSPGGAGSTGGFIASYADNTSVTGFDIYSVGFLPSGGKATAAQQTSKSMGVGDDQPALAYNAGGALAVWTQTSGATTSALRAIVPDSISPMATPVALGAPGNPVNKLALAPLGSDTYVLGYVGTDGMLKGQLLDSTGAVSGGEVTMSDNAVGGRFDVAGAALTGSSAQTLGAAVWETVTAGRHDVRMVRYEKGSFSTRSSWPPALMLTPPDQGRSPSIAAIAGGYVVAMRAHIGPDVGGVDKLRVLFVDAFFDQILDVRDYDTLVNQDGLVLVRVDNRGVILVVWSDDVANGANLHALRLDCTGA